MRTIAASLALLLAACGGDGGEGGNGSGNAGGGEAAGGGNGAGSGGESAGAGAGGAAGGVTMQAGEWETTTQVLAIEMPGMPPEAAKAMQQQPPQTVRSCLTEQQVARPPADFFAGAAQQGCDGSNMTMAGGRIQGTLQCTSDQGTMRITMDGQFAPTSFEIAQTMEVTAGGRPAMTTRARATGRRIGDCPAG
jgi:hypothetical protein